MDEIPIGVVGKILSGEHTGWELQVVDDSRNTGGFLVLVSENFNDPTSQGFDDWLESMEHLPAYFRESRWFVEWN